MIVIMCVDVFKTEVIFLCYVIMRLMSRWQIIFSNGVNPLILIKSLGEIKGNVYIIDEKLYMIETVVQQLEDLLDNNKCLKWQYTFVFTFVVRLNYRPVLIPALYGCLVNLCPESKLPSSRKNRQHKKKDKMTNNDLQNIPKTKDRATRIARISMK